VQAVDQITKNWMKYRMGVERAERGLEKGSRKRKRKRKRK
jgi:hypothetical protein